MDLDWQEALHEAARRVGLEPDLLALLRQDPPAALGFIAGVAHADPARHRDLLRVALPGDVRATAKAA